MAVRVAAGLVSWAVAERASAAAWSVALAQAALQRARRAHPRMAVRPALRLPEPEWSGAVEAVASSLAVEAVGSSLAVASVALPLPGAPA
jgi:hypothetical protein